MCREDGNGCDGSALQSTKVGDKIVIGSSQKESKDYKKRWYEDYLKDRYGWNVADDFTEGELRVIRQTAYDIQNYADDMTGGNGLDWMRQAFDNTTIIHWDGDHADALPHWAGPRIRLDKNWLTHSWGAEVVLAHELGHVWDINTIFTASYNMNLDLGGSGVCLLCAPGKGVPEWGPSYHYDYNSGDAYGNSGRNEYFAESFAAAIYNRGDNGVVISALDWIDAKVSNPLNNYP